jgi:hypothetical protein
VINFVNSFIKQFHLYFKGKIGNESLPSDIVSDTKNIEQAVTTSEGTSVSEEASADENNSVPSQNAVVTNAGPLSEGAPLFF